MSGEAARPTIGIAGMTHLGLNTAAAIAERGFDCICFDGDAALIGRITHGVLPVVEPELPGLLGAGPIRFTSEPRALAGCDVVYIAADVPTDESGQSELAGISALMDVVRAAMAADAVLVLLCQVPPGFTRALDMPPERLFYQVETLIFGRAVARARHPERYIVGCADPAAKLPAAYRTLLEAFGCPILRMGYESAELAKISINMCLVASIGVANTMAEICEQVGADWSEIVPALKSDRRIGAHAYLAPGLGIAGGNLERDLATVTGLAQRHGTDGRIVAAWLENSRHRCDWALRALHRLVLAENSAAAIAVLGLAYKEDTDSTRNAPALALIRHLAPYDITVYDPVVPAAAAGAAVKGADSALAAAGGADAVVIMTPWREFRVLAPGDLAAVMRGRRVIDPYRMIDPVAARAAGLDHHALGI
jgi:UDPglucose 6-dehydrogenase